MLMAKNQAKLKDSSVVPQGILLSLLEQIISFTSEQGFAVLTCFVVVSAYSFIQFSLVVYRLSRFHPLQGIPGPKLAHATSWYRTYYEVFRSGKMLDQLKKLHEEHGPVVRFGPNDIHFSSPSAYFALYNASSKITKDPWLYKCFSEDESSFGYIDAKSAKARRAHISPFFSRQNILSLEHVIQTKVDELHHQLAARTRNRETVVVDLGSALRSMTMDIIMSFCFGGCLDMLKDEEFRHPVIVFLQESIPLVWVFKNFPVVQKMMLGTPERVSVMMGGHGIVTLKKKINEQLDTFLQDLQYLDSHIPNSSHKVTTGAPRPKKIIFHCLLDTNNKPIATRQSLFDEAQALIVAGSDTVANTLSVGSFHILSNPQVYLKLRKELLQAWPLGQLDSKLRPNLDRLEKLTYLTAVIKESLRMTHGVVSPLSRIVPEGGMVVDGVFVPEGTVVASSAPFIHLDKSVFPDPNTFNPDRWVCADGTLNQHLDKFLVAFSRGPRACLGVNLAWCELYLAFALLYRKWDFELHETTANDVKFKEYFLPCLHGKIQAKVTQRLE